MAGPQFISFEQGIINVEDISTVQPYRADNLRWNPGDPEDGVRVTMRSKSTHIDLPGQTRETFFDILRNA